MAPILMVVLALLAFWQAKSASGTVRVQFPESLVGTAACTQRSGQAIASTRLGLEQTFECKPNTDVSCDFGTAEPADTPAEVLCSRGSFELFPAVAATLISESQVSTTVEWIDLRVQGRTITRATRTIASFPALLSVATDEGRLLRFRREGFAPRSVRAAELAQRAWSLPPPDGQSELIIRPEPAVVTPVSIVLADGQELPISHGVAIARGLIPGYHELIPKYSSGLKGLPIRAQVTARESLVAYVPAADVGAVEISADPIPCQATHRISVMRQDKGRGGLVSRELVGIDHGGDCRRMIAGLPPGPYDVSFGEQLESLITKPIEVRRQVISRLHVATSPVAVTGRLSLGGMPLSGTTLIFTSAGRARATGLPDSTARAKTAAGGLYIADLAAAGMYNVTVQSEGHVLLGQQRVVNVLDGHNSFDWDIAAGTASVSFRGWDRKTPVILLINQVGAFRPGLQGDSFQVDADSALPFRIVGLGPGDYEVRAKAGLLVSAVATFSAKAGTTSELILDLSSNRAAVQIVGEDGLPVREARVVGAKQNGPGRFLLDSVAPGTELQIFAPGYTPLCKRAPAGGEHRVQLERGTTVRIEFADQRLAEPIGALWWPRTECAVPLTGFTFGLTSVTVGRSAFQILNYPSGDQVALRLPGRPDRALEVVNGVVIIRIQ